MADPIEYQPQLLEGYQLRYDISARGIRISREMPGWTLLWSEAVAPIILIAFAIVFVVLIRTQISALNLPSGSTLIVQVVGYIAVLVWLLFNGRRAWQNVGIIIEITISGDTFYWRKQNLWGPNEYFWTLASIEDVAVENRLLKVRRRGGPPLTAFSFVKQEERTYACKLLNQAIAYQRRQLENEGR